MQHFVTGHTPILHVSLSPVSICDLDAACSTADHIYVDPCLAWARGFAVARLVGCHDRSFRSAMASVAVENDTLWRRVAAAEAAAEEAAVIDGSITPAPKRAGSEAHPEELSVRKRIRGKQNLGQRGSSGAFRPEEAIQDSPAAGGSASSSSSSHTLPLAESDATTSRRVRCWHRLTAEQWQGRAHETHMKVFRNKFNYWLCVAKENARLQRDKIRLPVLTQMKCWFAKHSDKDALWQSLDWFEADTEPPLHIQVWIQKFIRVHQGPAGKDRAEFVKANQVLLTWQGDLGSRSGRRRGHRRYEGHLREGEAVGVCSESSP